MKKGIICFTFLMLIVLTSCSSINKNRYCIFSNISEFEMIESEFSKKGEIQRYNDTSRDENLEGLQYVAHYAAYYKCEEFEFEIFAYEFQDTEEAHQYFYNHTGRESDRDTNFFGSGGMFSYDLVVIDGKNAYFASTSSGDVDEMYEFFSNVFSTKLF